MSSRMDRLFTELRARCGAAIPVPPRLIEISQEVCAKYQITLSALRSQSRTKTPMDARSEFCYRAMQETTHSYNTIGKFLGDRDHTTVMHAIERHCGQYGLAFARGATWIPRHRNRRKDCRQ